MAPTPVALLQVATRDEAFLFDLLALESPEDAQSPASPSKTACVDDDHSTLELSSCYRHVVSEILSRPGLLRLGFGFREDLRRMRDSYPLLARTLDEYLGGAEPDVIDIYSQQGGGSLATRVRTVLKCTLDKRMQTSDWSQRPLSQEQLEYAALDARCLVAIHDAKTSVAGSIDSSPAIADASGARSVGISPYRQYLDSLLAPNCDHHDVTTKPCESVPTGQVGLFASRDYDIDELIVVEPPLCACAIFRTEGCGSTEVLAGVESVGECECCLGALHFQSDSVRKCDFCSASWCSAWCAARSAALHAHLAPANALTAAADGKFGGSCGGQQWKNFVAAAKAASNEYFVLAARLFFALEVGCYENEFRNTGGRGVAVSDNAVPELNITESPFRGTRLSSFKDLPWGHFVGKLWWELVESDSDSDSDTDSRGDCQGAEDCGKYQKKHEFAAHEADFEAAADTVRSRQRKRRRELREQGARQLTSTQFKRLATLVPRAVQCGLATEEGLAATMGMLRMNAAGCRAFSDGRPGIALYPIVSRANHSCSPSALLTFDVRPESCALMMEGGGVDTSGMAILRATKRIASGEEITIDYASGTGSSSCVVAQRKKHDQLRAQYHFNCICALCTQVGL